MDFELTEDQKAMRDTVRDFVAREVEPRTREIDRTGKYPRDLVRKAA